MFGLKFLSVTNFQEMLIKLTFWHFVGALFCFWLLDKEVHFFSELFKGSIITLWEMKVPLLMAIFAIVWAGIMSHVFKLHDRISDVFRIRSRYDYKHILEPLTKSVIENPSSELLEKLKSNRHEAMTNMFYNFASSTDENPIVGKHNIHQALTSFSWYWVFLELAFTSFLTGLIIGVFNREFSILAFGMTAACLLCSLIVLPEIRKYTRSQITKILEDENASDTIRKYINALSS